MSVNITEIEPGDVVSSGLTPFATGSATVGAAPTCGALKRKRS
jgi:hypothetical protein